MSDGYISLLKGAFLDNPLTENDSKHRKQGLMGDAFLVILSPNYRAYILD